VRLADSQFGTGRLWLYGTAVALFLTALPLIFRTHAFVIGLSMIAVAGLITLGTCATGYLTQRRSRIPQKQSHSAGTRNDLELTIAEEVAHPFEHKALILELKIIVRNKRHTPAAVRGLRANSQIYEEGQPAPAFDFMTDIEVAKEVERLKHQHNSAPKQLEPGKTVFWYVLSLPRRLQGGEPEYTITLEDAHRHEYTVKRLGRPK